MRPLHALIAIFMLAFAVVALDACATAPATKQTRKKHRAAKKASAQPASAPANALAVREELDADSGEEDDGIDVDGEDNDGDGKRDFAEQELTALSVSEGGASYNPCKMFFERHKTLIDATPAFLPEVKPHTEEVKAFCRALVEDTPVPVTGEEALMTTRIIDAIYRSSEEGREVAVVTG